MKTAGQTVGIVDGADRTSTSSQSRGNTPTSPPLAGEGQGGVGFPATNQTTYKHFFSVIDANFDSPPPFPRLPRPTSKASQTSFELQIGTAALAKTIFVLVIGIFIPMMGIVELAIALYEPVICMIVLVIDIFIAMIGMFGVVKGMFIVEKSIFLLAMTIFTFEMVIFDQMMVIVLIKIPCLNLRHFHS